MFRVHRGTSNREETRIKHLVEGSEPTTFWSRTQNINLEALRYEVSHIKISVIAHTCWNHAGTWRILQQQKKTTTTEAAGTTTKIILHNDNK